MPLVNSNISERSPNGTIRALTDNGKCRFLFSRKLKDASETWRCTSTSHPLPKGKNKCDRSCNLKRDENGKIFLNFNLGGSVSVKSDFQSFVRFFTRPKFHYVLFTYKHLIETKIWRSSEIDKRTRFRTRCERHACVYHRQRTMWFSIQGKAKKRMGSLAVQTSSLTKNAMHAKLPCQREKWKFRVAIRHKRSMYLDE